MALSAWGGLWSNLWEIVLTPIDFNWCGSTHHGCEQHLPGAAHIKGHRRRKASRILLAGFHSCWWVHQSCCCCCCCLSLSWHRTSVFGLPMWMEDPADPLTAFWNQLLWVSNVDQRSMPFQESSRHPVPYWISRDIRYHGLRNYWGICLSSVKESLLDYTDHIV